MMHDHYIASNMIQQMEEDKKPIVDKITMENQKLSTVAKGGSTMNNFHFKYSLNIFITFMLAVEHFLSL